jgi:hypothetical protein
MEGRRRLLVVVFVTLGFLFVTGMIVLAPNSHTNLLANDRLPFPDNTLSDFVPSEESMSSFPITIDASGISLNLLVPGYGWMGVGAISTFDFSPGVYSFTDSAGANLPSFEVASSGAVSYAIELDGVVYTGSGTSTLSILGFPIVVDASSLSVGVWVLGASTGWIIDPVTHYLPAMTTNPYNFRISHGGGAWDVASFYIDQDGTTLYDASIDGILLNGLGTSTIEVLGFPILVDASSLSVGVWIGGSVSGWVTESYTYILPALAPVPYAFSISNGAGLWTNAGFNVELDGTVDYDPSIDDVLLSGFATSSLEVLGFPILVDAAGISVSVWISGSTSGWVSETYTYTLPALTSAPYTFTAVTTSTTLEESTFTVDLNGMVQYDPFVDGIHLNGLGTSTIEIIGFPVTINATGVSSDITIQDTGDHWISDYHTYYLPASTQVIYRLYTDAPEYIDSFQVLPDGTLSKTVISFELGTIHLVLDDDIFAPVIYGYYTGDYTDGNPGYIIVYAEDESGLAFDPSGQYPVQNVLDVEQIFTFTAVDDDNDCPDDQLSTTVTFSITLNDDDTDPPAINWVDYESPIYNNKSDILVTMSLSDISGIDSVFLTFNGIQYSASLASGLWYASIPMPEPGSYYFTLTVIDNDNDRDSDSLTTTQMYPLEVLQSSIIEDLELTIDILGFSLDLEYGVDVAFRVSANLPIDDTYVVLITLEETTFDQLGTYAVKLTSLGVYTVYASVTDQSGESAGASTEFVLDADIVKQAILDEISVIEFMIENSPEEYWKSTNSIDTMLLKIDELIILVQTCQMQDAYDKLLYDIKPKLTGLKEDEDGTTFGNGIFKNVWVLDGSLRLEFELHINSVLWALAILI